jgi:hypothetical protein
MGIHCGGSYAPRTMHREAGRRASWMRGGGEYMLRVIGYWTTTVIAVLALLTFAAADLVQ